MLGFKQIKWNSTVNLIILFIIGILLLIFPVESLKIACYLIASMLMISGFSYIIKLIKKKTIETNEDIITLLVSIISIIISVIIFVDSSWTIRIINIVIGLFLIINSIINIISLFKFKKDRSASWWIFLSFAIIILILGIFAIINPEFLSNNIVRIEGSTLIIDTIITFILTLKIKKILEKSNDNKVIKEVSVD